MTSFIVRAATDMAFSDLTALASAAPARAEVALTSPAPAVTHYRLAEINGIEMFYREPVRRVGLPCCYCMGFRSRHTSSAT